MSGIEVVSWSQSYDSDGSGLLVLQDAYEDESAEELICEFNFSNADCGDVDWSVELGGSGATTSFSDSGSYDFNNYDFEIAYPFDGLTEGTALATLNVIEAETCDDNAVFMSDQYEIELRETHTGGGGGGGGSEELTLSDLDWSCSVSPSEIELGDDCTVTVELTGDSPTDNPWSVPIEVFADEQPVATAEGNVTINGAQNETISVTPPSTGTYNLNVELYEPYERT